MVGTSKLATEREYLGGLKMAFEVAAGLTENEGIYTAWRAVLPDEVRRHTLSQARK